MTIDELRAGFAELSPDERDELLREWAHEVWVARAHELADQAAALYGTFETPEQLEAEVAERKGRASWEQ